jgi:diacylglycerol kinase (ATP)
MSDPKSQLALVNLTSGNQQGQVFVLWLQQLLGEESVFCTTCREQVRNILETNIDSDGWKVFVCGGDGTCNLVVQVLQYFPWKVCMIHIPIGTGNDLSRSLGWGGSCKSFKELERFINYAQHANIERVDVWSVSVQQNNNNNNNSFQRESTFMVGFLSLGIDAQVELCFNESRWKNPSSYRYTWLNIAKYGWYGLQTMWKWSRVAGLQDFVESLEVDGVPLHIPCHIQSILVLNLPSYGAGALPIPHTSNTSDQWNVFGNDGLIEIVGITGLLHFLGLELGMSAIKLGQGRNISIRLKQNKIPIAIQVSSRRCFI